MPTYLSAKNAKVRLAGFVVRSTKWSAEIITQKLDVTNFDSTGFGEYVQGGGISDANVEIEFPLEVTNMGMFATVLPGAFLPSCFLYPNDTTSTPLTFALLAIESVTVSAEVRGVVQVAIKAYSSGSITLPSAP